MIISRQFLQKHWLYLGIVIVGMALKFYGIENKYFWRDEISTIQHTSGNQILKIPVNEIKNISYYKNQLRLKKQNLTIRSEFIGLYRSTNLNPLHYTFLMIWYRIVGDDLINYRLFNIFILILTLPILFMLAKKLFESDLAGWMAIGLYLFSPYFHHYFHQARYHILLAFLIISLHYLFIQAITCYKLKWWIAYAFTGILALYASVLSGLIVSGHFIYILFFKKEFRLTYSILLIIILSGYIPWIISMIVNKGEIASSLAWHNYFGYTLNPIKLLLYQIVGFTQYFEHFAGITQHAEYLIFHKFKGNYFYMIINAVLLVFILSSIIYTIRKAPVKISSFLILIVLPFVLFFLISDIFRKTLGSIMWRYHLINFIGISLFAVYLIQRKIKLGKLLFVGIYIALILIGFISIMRVSQDRCSAAGPECSNRIKEAQFFSKAQKPLLITDYSLRVGSGIESFFAMMNECSSKDIDILTVSSDVENLERLLAVKNYSEIYVTQSSEELIRNLKSQFGKEIDSLEIEGTAPLWQIKL